MYILINFSKKIERFNLYANCFNVLFRNHQLEYLDFSKEIDDANMDFSLFTRKIQSCLTNAGMSVYNLIVLYDFELQQKEPLVYSTTAMLHNIQNQIVNQVRDNRYEVECVYFITIDDASKDKDNGYINNNLISSLEFDKNGYITETDIPCYINKNDLDLIKSTIESVTSKHQKDKNYKKAFDEICTLALNPIEKRVVKSLDNYISVNDNWYGDCIIRVFKDYKKELELFFDDIVSGNRSFENLGFSLENYLRDNVSSFYDIEKNKILRFDMVKNIMHANVNEVKFKNYFKLVAFIIFIINAEKKYVFGNAYLSKQNHYVFDVNIEDKVISQMLNDFDSNLKYQQLRLGEIKFNEIDIEEFEKIVIEANIKDENRYDVEKPKFSLLKNDNNLRDVEEYGKKCQDRYVDFVNYSNQRLSKTTDKLRVSMLKEFVGKKVGISANDLFRIIGEKENQVKILKEKIASNTPDDIIQLDFRIFEEIKKKVQQAKVLLNHRITLGHMLLNAAMILGISFFMFPLVRRFDNGASITAQKVLMWLTPMIVYIVVQLFFCFLRAKRITGVLLEIDEYTRERRDEIRCDDIAFTQYVNDIYELMLLTKYINKLKENANNSNIDITNFRYHKNMIDRVIDNNNVLAKNLRIIINNANRELVNIPLEMNYNEIENDMYCPLLYVPENSNNYILINTSKNMEISDRLLNFVDSMELRFDNEVYDEWC